MNYLKLVPQSTSNGPGIRVVLFCSGCRNHCPGCQNPETWSFAAGEPFTAETEEEILRLLNKPHIAGLTLCGGEPFEPENQEGLANLLKLVKTKCPEKSIWCYTGYEWEDLMPYGKKNIEITLTLLQYIDVLIVGHYDLKQRDITNDNLYRGSRNQRVINVRESIENNTKVMMHNIPNNC